MFCHRSEGASWLEEWKELMIKNELKGLTEIYGRYQTTNAG